MATQGVVVIVGVLAADSEWLVDRWWRQEDLGFKTSLGYVRSSYPRPPKPPLSQTNKQKRNIGSGT